MNSVAEFANKQVIRVLIVQVSRGSIDHLIHIFPCLVTFPLCYVEQIMINVNL